MKIITIFFATFILISACSQKAMTPLEHKGRQIILGNGGGFTGAVSQYYFTDDGTLYRTGMDDTTFVKVGVLNANTTKQLFNSYDKMGLNKMVVDDPGNRYYYVIMKDKEGKEHKIQWGKSELQDKSVSILYENIMALIKKQNTETSNKQ